MIEQQRPGKRRRPPPPPAQTHKTRKGYQPRSHQEPGGWRCEVFRRRDPQEPWSHKNERIVFRSRPCTTRREAYKQAETWITDQTTAAGAA